MLFHHRRWRLLSLLCVAPVIALASLMLGTHADAQTGQRCFPETGQCISGRIRVFWERNGGLPVFGFPITPQRAETTREGTFQAQWFERHRLELHPENQPPYDVQIGRAGDIRLQQQGRDWFTFPRADEATRNRSDCHFFPETGQSVCGLFWQAYRRYGLDFGVPGVSFEESLGLFGMPLSPPQIELAPNGQMLLTQWFERARFEHHPQNQAPFDVLFGRLGAEILEQYQTPPATPTPAPPTPTAGPGPGGCTLRATFIRDVAVPNDTALQPGARFERIWRVRNDGTCYWESYTLVFARGDQMGGPASVPVPNTEPGAQVDISVPLRAPTAPGTYRGFWVLRATNGSTFDGLVTQIQVPEPAATATPTAPPVPSTSLVGPIWLWQSTLMNDDTLIVAADPARYTLQLNADGTIAVQADCNRVTGTYDLAGSSLTLAFGTSTRAACPPDSQAEAFLRGLQNIGGYLFDGSDLILELKFDSGTMRFARAP